MCVMASKGASIIFSNPRAESCQSVAVQQGARPLFLMDHMGKKDVRRKKKQVRGDALAAFI